MNHRIKLTRLFAFVSLCVYQNRSLSLLRTVNIAAILIFLVNLFFGQIQIIIRWQQLKRNRVKLEIDKKKKKCWMDWVRTRPGSGAMKSHEIQFIARKMNDMVTNKRKMNSICFVFRVFGGVMWYMGPTLYFGWGIRKPKCFPCSSLNAKKKNGTRFWSNQRSNQTSFAKFQPQVKWSDSDAPTRFPAEKWYETRQLDSLD